MEHHRQIVEHLECVDASPKNPVEPQERIQGGLLDLAYWALSGQVQWAASGPLTFDDTLMSSYFIKSFSVLTKVLINDL
jgi:hypothetical protein